MHYNFEYDLKDGEDGQRFVLCQLRNKKIEVKRDLMCKETGNVVIEFESRGKPSGISTTHADWWVYILDDDTFLYLTIDKIKHIVKNKKPRIVNGGDNKTSRMYLLKKEDLL